MADNKSKSSTMPTRDPPERPKEDKSKKQNRAPKHDYAYCITTIEAPPSRGVSKTQLNKPKSRQKQCYAKCSAMVRPCMARHNPIWDDASCWEQFKYGLMCPPHGHLAKCVTLVLMTLLLWGVLWAITGDEALPGGNLFSLFVLIICCVLGGFVVGLIHLPPLLGMLVVGFALRNIPYIDIANDINKEWSIALRSMALVVILIHAGLGLDAQALKRLSIVCVRLCCLPCIAEACTVGIVAHFLLDFPWLWGFMLGFVLGAVTPAVIVPTLMSLQERGYGVTKGVPTLIIAAASADDVLAISAFGVILGATFATGNIVFSILKGPLELLMGVAFGCICGVILWFIPPIDQKPKQVTMQRFMMVFGGGLFSVFGSGAAGFPGAGALGALSMAFVAGQKWKKEKESVERLVGITWQIFEPVLFGLIGAEVAIEDLDPKTIGLGLATLGIGLIVRVGASMLAVTGAKLNLKEKIFIAISWLPKATVQAAIGSIARDTAAAMGKEDLVQLGNQLLTIAVLSIIVTAPLGAIAIVLTGPRLLEKSDVQELKDENDSEEEEEEEAEDRYLEPEDGEMHVRRNTGDVEMRGKTVPAEHTNLLTEGKEKDRNL